MNTFLVIAILLIFPAIWFVRRIRQRNKEMLGCDPFTDRLLTDVNHLQISSGSKKIILDVNKRTAWKLAGLCKEVEKALWNLFSSKDSSSPFYYFADLGTGRQKVSWEELHRFLFQSDKPFMAAVKQHGCHASRVFLSEESTIKEY